VAILEVFAIIIYVIAVIIVEIISSPTPLHPCWP
jgi:hypothetical protein